MKHFERPPHRAPEVAQGRDALMLTGIARGMETGRLLTRRELVTLYELEAPLMSFDSDGNRDARIAELRARRNPDEDMRIVFACGPEGIAHNSSEITERTKAYEGPLAPGVFDRLWEHKVNYIYAWFPERRIVMTPGNYGGETPRALIATMRDRHITVSAHAETMIMSADADSYARQPRSIIYVRLKASALGLPLGKFPTTEEIYARAGELGLERCSAAAAPYYRLSYTNQPPAQWAYMAMDPIAARDGYAYTFLLTSDEHGPRLREGEIALSSDWDPENEFVFCFYPRAQESSPADEQR